VSGGKDCAQSAPQELESPGLCLIIMNDHLPPRPSIPLGRYRHYKGGEYEVLGVVRHSESLEPIVLDRPLYNASGSWVRPFNMFLEPVEHGSSRTWPPARETS
jgi:hypothetical protein